MKLKQVIMISGATALLAGCSFFQPAKSNQPAEPESSMSSTVAISSTNESSSVASQSSSSSSSISEDPNATFLDESIDSTSEYTKTKMPSGVNLTELNMAINDYFKAHFTEEDKKINAVAIEDVDLTALQNALDSDPTVATLGTKVDQITLKLDGKDYYVARLIVPMTQKEANQQVEESEITLMNHALTQLGNRLVLVGYYDSATKTVTPANLSNSTTPLFYYSGE